ncbi:hypothetical protein [Pseudomonas neuropathica]|uniref:hypothetical protein n=1 Tax=Pseudomonas neuropathica TaxID=2730425 RepID=UPI003F765C81
MSLEVGGNEIHQQQLVNLLLVVNAVCGHYPVRLEHSGYFNLEPLDAQCSVLCCSLLTLPALLDGFRCRLQPFRRELLFFSH